MPSSDPREHKRLGRGVHSFDCAIWDRVREDTVLAGTLAKFTQNPAIKQHLLSTRSNILAEASPFDPFWGIGLQADDPEAQDPTRWRGKKCLGKLFPPFAASFAQVRPGLHTPPSLINFALRQRPTEFMRFLQRRPTLWPWPAHAQVLPWSFRPVFLTRLLTTVLRFWLPHLISTLLSRCVRTRPLPRRGHHYPRRRLFYNQNRASQRSWRSRPFWLCGAS